MRKSQISALSNEKSKRGRAGKNSLPPANGFNLGKMDETILFMKEDIDTIIVSLKSSSVEDQDNIRRTKSLLETLSSFLISTKSNHSMKFSIDFIQQILSLNQLLENVNIVLCGELDRTKLNLLFQVQNLALKNVRNLLKITNGLKNDSYAKLLENIIDYLITIRDIIIRTDRQLNREIAIQLDNVALSLLKCMFFISSKCEFEINEISKTNLCSKFIGILRCFSFYGLDNYELSKLSIQLYPSPISQFFAVDAADSSTKKRKGKLDEYEILEEDSLFNTSSISFSTSEYSSSELDEDSIRDVLSKREAQYNKKIFAKIRMMAYESLQSSFSMFGIRIVFGFWSFLFPDIPNLADNTQFSVLLTIAKDSSNRVRTSALNFMYNFFNFGKLFVRTLVSESQYSKQTSSKAFTPLSVSMTSMVKELHSVLERVLMKESNSAILILIYKVSSLIVTITPYNKLCTDILHPLFYRNSFLLDHKLTQIKNLSLALYVKMFTPEFLPKDFRSWLIEDKVGLETLNKIFKCCFDFVDNPDYILLCIESIKLLTSIIKHHGLMIDLFNCQSFSMNIVSISKLSIDTIQNERSLTNPVLQSLICKFIHALGMLFKHLSNKNVVFFVSNDDKLLFIKNWFLQIFTSKLFRLALTEVDMNLVKSSTQVTLINVISLIPEEVFTQIDHNTHYHIISILMSLSKDEIIEINPGDQDEANLPIYTKSAAIRCLSIIQSFTCLADDISLTSDLIEICLDSLNRNDTRTKNQKKKEIFLIEHSLWALANICDVIKKNHLEMEIDDSLLNRIVVCLQNCYDINHIQYHTDDILVNLVRSSGIVLYLILTKQSMPNENSDVIVSSKSSCEIDRFILLTIVMNFLEYFTTKRLYKLQWNICIALSYLLPLDNFVEMCRTHSQIDKPNLLLHIYDVLYQTYRNSPNHKVQSYSIFTICSTSKLSYFQDQLAHLWPFVVKKFISDFNIVPIHSQQSWLEKYVFALERLAIHYILADGDNLEQSSKDHLDMLKEFVENELKNNHNEALRKEIKKLWSILS